jgi:uncharacterized membrane protein YfcA
MRKIADRSLAVLLIMGAGGGHVAGSIMAYHERPLVLLWALCAGALGVLIGALNLLRAGRPDDRSVAWLTVCATACWLVISVAFGILIGNPLDPRVIGFVAIAGGLMYFGLPIRPARARSPSPPRSAAESPERTCSPR